MIRCLILSLALILAAASARAYELVPQANAVDADLPGLELEVDLVIGADEDGEVILGSVSSVAVAPDGDIFLCDMRLNLVYRLDESGQLLATLGQAGEGPGDLGFTSVIAMGPDGRIRLASRGSRVDVLDGEWNVLGGFDRPNPGTDLRSLGFAPNGDLFVAAANVHGGTMIDRSTCSTRPTRSAASDSTARCWLRRAPAPSASCPSRCGPNRRATG